MIYTNAEFESLSLHDCHLYGFSWKPAKFQMILDLDFIMEWIEPAAAGQGYQFRVCQAELCFLNVSDQRIDLDWTHASLAVTIDMLLRREIEPSANGTPMWKYTIELNNPSGEITLNATGFELRLSKEVQLSVRQHMRY